MGAEEVAARIPPVTQVARAATAALPAEEEAAAAREVASMPRVSAVPVARARSSSSPGSDPAESESPEGARVAPSAVTGPVLASSRRQGK